MPNTSRGNFSLLTLMASVVTVGAIIGLNLGSNTNVEPGWPLSIIRGPRYDIDPVCVLFDIAFNFGVLAAVAYGCESWSVKSQRAGLNATSPFDRKNQD